MRRPGYRRGAQGAAGGRCRLSGRGGFPRLQAIEIASAAALNPSAQEQLLYAAELEELKELRRQCARVRAAARSEEERERYLHRHRRLNTWTDPEGAFRMSAWLTPQSGAVVMASLEPFRQKVTLRSDGKDSAANLAADALVAMAEHSRHVPDNALRPGPGAMVHVRVDQAALERGFVEKGEICEVPGVGPIPVAAARALMSDASISAVVTDGEDIHSVVNLGRTIPSRMRIALIERDQVCAVPGCGCEQDLEIDHIVPVYRGGKTYLGNLVRLCHFHHYQKTYHGYQIKRLKGGGCGTGPTGRRPIPRGCAGDGAVGGG